VTVVNLSVLELNAPSGAENNVVQDFIVGMRGPLVNSEVWEYVVIKAE